MEIFAQAENGGLKRLELFLEAGILSETRDRGWSLVLETLKDRKYAQLLRSNTHPGLAGLDFGKTLVNLAGLDFGKTLVNLAGLDFGKTLVKTSFAKRRIGCCTFSKKDWHTIMTARRRRIR